MFITPTFVDTSANVSHVCMQPLTGTRRVNQQLNSVQKHSSKVQITNMSRILFITYIKSIKLMQQAYNCFFYPARPHWLFILVFTTVLAQMAVSVVPSLSYARIMRRLKKHFPRPKTGVKLCGQKARSRGYGGFQQYSNSLVACGQPFYCCSENVLQRTHVSLIFSVLNYIVMNTTLNIIRL